MLVNKSRSLSALSILFGCIGNLALAQKPLTVIVFDVRTHKYVPGVMVEVFALSAHNAQLGTMPGDPYSYSVNVKAITGSDGRATFETEGLMRAVELVNSQLEDSSRKLMTRHYEVGIYVLRGGQCTYSNQSLHQIMESGVVGGIANPPCKTDVKPQDFHAKPGEIIMFQAHAM